MLYAGGVLGSVAGVLQLNVRVPSNARSGDAMGFHGRHRRTVDVVSGDGCRSLKRGENMKPKGLAFTQIPLGLTIQRPARCKDAFSGFLSCYWDFPAIDSVMAQSHGHRSPRPET